MCSTDSVFCLLQYLTSVTLLKLDFTMGFFRGIFRILKFSAFSGRKFFWKVSQLFTRKNLWWSLFLVKLNPLTLLRKDSVTFVWLLKPLRLKKNSINASKILKFWILKKGLRNFFTTFKVINAQKGLHHFQKHLHIFNTEKRCHHCLNVFNTEKGLHHFHMTHKIFNTEKRMPSLS